MSGDRVVFKGSKNGILVIIDDGMSFEQIKEAVAIRAREAKKFFSKTKSALSFEADRFTHKEIMELVDIIATESELLVVFIGDEIYTEKYTKEKKSNIEETTIQSVHTKEQPNPPSMQKISGLISEHENNTFFHRGSMRSGHSIKYSGSVVVFGDMNPGSEVIAEGNVIILGHAKGLIHAGCGGNENCFVFGLELSPTQLRIAKIITYIPKDVENKRKIRPKPTYAYVENGRIFISEFE